MSDQNPDASFKTLQVNCMSLHQIVGVQNIQKMPRQLQITAEVPEGWQPNSQATLSGQMAWLTSRPQHSLFLGGCTWSLSCKILGHGPGRFKNIV